MRLADEREVDTTRNFERTYVPGLAQIDGDDAATGDYAFYLTDHLGSTRGLYDSAKARVGGYEFSPYGSVYAASAFAAAAQQYTGHHWDAASALYFAPYRYYSPTMARWLTRDPLGMADGPNVYAYVMGNPIIFTDKSGKFILPILPILTGCAAGVVGAFLDILLKAMISTETVDGCKNKCKLAAGCLAGMLGGPLGRIFRSRIPPHLRDTFTGALSGFGRGAVCGSPCKKLCDHLRSTYSDQDDDRE